MRYQADCIRVYFCYWVGIEIRFFFLRIMIFCTTVFPSSDILEHIADDNDYDYDNGDDNDNEII